MAITISAIVTLALVAVIAVYGMRVGGRGRARGGRVEKGFNVEGT